LIQYGLIGGEDPITKRYSELARVSNMFSTDDETSLAYYLNNKYLNSFKQKKLLVKGKNYIGTYVYESDYRYDKLFLVETNTVFSLPKIGELYNSNTISDTGYWCLDVFNTKGYMMTVLNIHNQVEYVMTTRKKEVKTVVFVSPLAIIVSGTGTIDDPYVIG
jgi:hypothetical protein